MIRKALGLISCALILCVAARLAEGAEAFRIATYNLNNYLLHASGSRPAKSDASKAKIRESVAALKADVLAVQEIGGAEALAELRTLLGLDGLSYPYWEHITAHDTEIQVAVLSRFPIIARNPHTNDSFLLYGRRFRAGRGFAEVQIQVNSNYVFSLITTHLKSRLPVPAADEADLREQEAILLHEKIDRILKNNPDANLVVLGDLNDTKSSVALRTIIGKGSRMLIDARPAERNGDDQWHPHAGYDPPKITWTHYYGKEDTYSRIDYILLSPGMVKEWNRADTFIPTLPNWGIGSDHRPIAATFWAENR